MPSVTAGAIIGGSVIGAGASMMGASKASKAASQAADANAQVQREIFQQTRQDLAPYTQAGVPAVAALQSRLGLTQPAPAANGNAKSGYAGTSPAMASDTPGAVVDPTYTGPTGFTRSAPPPGYEQYGGVGAPQGQMPASASGSSAAASPYIGADGQLTPEGIAQIVKDRPDVLQAAQAGGGDVNANINYWYNTGHQAVGDTYQLPAAPQAPQTDPNAPPRQPVPGETYTSANNAGLGPRQDFTRPDLSRPDFTQAEPTYNTPDIGPAPTFGPAPSSADYLDPSKFQTSPGYQFRLDQGQRNLNAASAARGLAKSGSAIQGAIDYGQGAASSEYGNWFNQQSSRLAGDRGQYNTDRSTALQQYNIDADRRLGQFNTDRNVGLAQYNQNRNVFNTNYAFDTSRADNNYNTDVGRYDSNFNTDRGYNQNVYDAYTGNLFNLANMGQSAAGGQANAGQNYAAAATANNSALASVRGNAAIAGANGVNSAINAGMQAYGMYSNPFTMPVSQPGGTMPASMAGLY